MSTLNTNGACRNCGGVLVDDPQSCPYCGSAQYFEMKRLVSFLVQNRTLRRVVFYPFVMLGGLAAFLVIYLFYFRQLSETRLMELAPFWLFTFVFGYFGYTSERFLQSFYFRRAGSVREACFAWQWQNLPWSVFYLPVPILEFKNPLSHAVWGSFIWMLSLKAFFMFLWQSL